MNKNDIFITGTEKLRNEGLTIEYKETFNFGSLAMYFKTMMAFANNKGGSIIFGVTNYPRTIKGLIENSQFHTIDIERIFDSLKITLSLVGYKIIFIFVGQEF